MKPETKPRAGTHSIDGMAPLLIGVQTNPERDVSLESLAREWGYSPSRFHQLFTETVGETPRAHVQRVRLERAAFVAPRAALRRRAASRGVAFRSSSPTTIPIGLRLTSSISTPACP